MRSLPLLVSAENRKSIVRAMASELGLEKAEVDLALELSGRGLPPLTRRTWLPFLFGISPKLIGSMVARPTKHYRRFQLAKRSGGTREIVTPRRFLKTIQRWLLEHVVSQLQVSDSAHGFVRGRGIFTNAEPHLASRNLLAVDVADFFPSVTKDQIVEQLSQLPYPKEVVSQLAGLFTLDGALPQGAPTSPALANAVFYASDVRLKALAENWECVYTRYADDIAISGFRQFSPEDIDAVEGILQDAGFQLNRRKSQILGAGAHQKVAGIVVNSAGLPPRELRRRWRATFHRASRYPREFGDRVHQLHGIAAFVNQYDEELAGSYWAIAERVPDYTGRSAT